MLKVYTALKVSPATRADSPDFEGKHITTSFMQLADTKAIDFSKVSAIVDTAGFLTITNIVYWEKAKVTVAIPAVTYSLVELKVLLESTGHVYEGYEWCPHITMAYGEDQTANYKHLVGQQVRLSDFYIRIKEFK